METGSHVATVLSARARPLGYDVSRRPRPEHAPGHRLDSWPEGSADAAPGQCGGDEQRLDLRGAFEDPVDRRVTVRPFQQQGVGEPETAGHLDGIDGHVTYDVSGEQLGLGPFGRSHRGTGRLKHGGAVDHEAGRVDLGALAGQ